ncbi:MAG: hypothetical protein V4485_05525, partial [Pseudomonadota bacterium]
MPDISFTVDLSEVRKSISSEAAPSLYHDLDYLNTNLTLPSLSNLRTRLMQKPNQPFGFFEKRKLSNDLFKSLKDWAYRNPGYGVKEAYEEYAKSRNSTSRKKFVEHCAKVTSLGEEWTHNQVEKVVAIVLRGLEGGNPPGKIKEALDDAMESYVQTSREQARKDFDRNDIVFYDGVKVLDVKEGGQTGPYQVFTRENFSSLTGEQMGFITTLCDQGKFAGGQTVPVMQDMADNKGVILTTESQTSILQKDGRTYVIRREDLSDQSMTDPAAPKVKRCTMSTNIDI